MKEIQQLLTELTIPEKAALLEGYQSWMTNGVPRLDIPAVYLTDGPVGVRKKSNETSAGALGLGSAYPSTAFPTPVSMANSWDVELARKVGRAMGEECAAYNVDVLLAPAMNLKRDPRCGRNFEYYSEDPLLAGKLAAAFTAGVQSTGTAACPKHFALNNSENFRYMGDSVVDERAARELYLKAFEICVKEAHPRTVMCSYNKVNGTHASENKWLLTDVLRDEWGFDGLVMSDWGAVCDRVAGIRAGLDLDMPGGVLANRKAIIQAAESGALSMEELDRAVANVLRLVAEAKGRTEERNEAAGGERSRAASDGSSGRKKENGEAGERRMENTDMAVLLREHDSLAAQMAADCAVLLKNNGILPLKKGTRVLAVGDLFGKMCYQGAGSSGISPKYLTSPKDAFDRAGENYTFVRGYNEMTREPDERLESEALSAAERADVILFFGGLTELLESEGFDRQDLGMPENQLSLIGRLVRAGKPVAVVLFGGSPMELPFADQVDGILNMFLPGQSGGEACRRILYGEANPGGRLSETWMKTCGDIPGGDQYSRRKIEEYRENIFVGYRYYDRAPGRVRYPFGHGLSYTTFDYRELTVKHTGEVPGSRLSEPNSEAVISVALTVTNTGSRDGAEVVQLYVGKNRNTAVFKAEKELKAFRKVCLKAGESRKIMLEIRESELAYYHTGLQRWVVENGTYPILVGASASDIRLSGKIEVTGYAPVPAPYSRETVEAYGKFGIDRLTDYGGISDRAFEETIGRPIPKEPAGYPYTVESSLTDYRNSRMGRFVLKVLNMGLTMDGKKYERLPEGPAKDALIKNQRFILNLVPRNCPRSLMQSGGGGILQMNLAHALTEFANGHVLKALGWLIQSVKM